MCIPSVCFAGPGFVLKRGLYALREPCRRTQSAPKAEGQPPRGCPSVVQLPRKFQAYVLTTESEVSLATAARYPSATLMSDINHLLPASASPRISSTWGGKSGCVETEKSVSGKERPSPVALRNASLRVQQAKNPATLK